MIVHIKSTATPIAGGLPENSWRLSRYPKFLCVDWLLSFVWFCHVLSTCRTFPVVCSVSSGRQKPCTLHAEAIVGVLVVEPENQWPMFPGMAQLISPIQVHLHHMNGWCSLKVQTRVHGLGFWQTGSFLRLQSAKVTGVYLNSNQTTTSENSAVVVGNFNKNGTAITTILGASSRKELFRIWHCHFWHEALHLVCICTCAKTQDIIQKCIHTRGPVAKGLAMFMMYYWHMRLYA